MTIKTKFDIGQYLYFIKSHELVVFPVSKITFDQYVNYHFITSKGATLMDKDFVVQITEDRCFASIDDLCSFYKEKLKQK